MPNRPIAAVIFDLFHTLVNFSAIPDESATSTLLGVDPRAWSMAVIEHSPHHALGSVADPYESVRRIAHAIDPTIPEELIRAAVAARPDRFRRALTDVRPEVLEMLKALRALGLKIGLISNAGLDEIEAWDNSPLAPHFDAVLVSCHERLMKPDPAIYQLAAERLGVGPEQCLFVGDGGSREHEGARAAKMQTALILGFLRETDPHLADARPRITDWVVETHAELLEIVRARASSSQ